MSRQLLVIASVGLALFLCFAFVVSASGRGSYPSQLSIQTATPSPTSAPLRDDTLLQDTSLLVKNPACALPCWRDIIPGQTSWDTALKKLKDDPSLENVTVHNSSSSSALLVDFQQKGGTSCCQVITEDGHTVDVVFVRIAPKINMSQLIAAQGQPTYVIGSPYVPGQAVMNLIYPRQALVLYVFVAGTEGSLSATSEIVGALYMPHADMDLLIRTSSLHAWEGYQSYFAYDSSAYVVTPSITSTPTRP